jgi:uncharacterized membrane protein
MAGRLARILRHMSTTRWQLRRAFGPATLSAIEQAVASCEAVCDVEVRFVAEGAIDGLPLLRGQTPRERAIEVFSLMRVWDTERNNGVLIHVLLADRSIEIVADRGIHAQVGADRWDALCRQMEDAFRQADFERGAIACIEALQTVIPRRGPSATPRRDELPDKPALIP